jgi:hypothetical protein
MELTQSYLKSILHYDPDTGFFAWIAKRRRGRFAHRQEAGGSDRSGYVRVKINGSLHAAHRLAFLYMNGVLPEKHVDHINGIYDDNRWANLRAVSGAENAKNKCIQKNNHSGVSGVFWDAHKKKWTAKIVVERKHIKLGNYKSIADAIAARQQAESYYGFHENHGRLSKQIRARTSP